MMMTMIKSVSRFVIGYVLLLGIASGADRIDRQALVRRHNLEWDTSKGIIPVGNGEFAFGADCTGLQTFRGNAMSHWGWHSDPLPPNITPDQIPVTGTIATGKNLELVKTFGETPELSKWLRFNPHRMNLFRLRFLHEDGSPLVEEKIENPKRHLDLWTGLMTSRFEVSGQPVKVETSVHPTLDAVAVRIESPLIRTGKLVVAIDFPYPDVKGRRPWVGDWDRPDDHQTVFTIDNKVREAGIRRIVDSTRYSLALSWSPNISAVHENKTEVRHQLILRGDEKNADGKLELFCITSPEGTKLGQKLGVAEVQQAATQHWKKFWMSGGAIDLSQSSDKRWMELERRIVLSQYQMGVNSAGSWPAAESGLLDIDAWIGQFHMEMTWWHLAHFALWDRWPMAERAAGCYQRFLPTAKQLAGQFQTRGAKWGKQVGPEGRTGYWEYSFILQWSQPHPIFLAELEYRLRPTRETLEKWREVVLESAQYMADYVTLDTKGVYNLTPVMPACEYRPEKGKRSTCNSVFELAYWRFGLEKAQQWRTRLGMERDPQWDRVLKNLAPLPQKDGIYVLSPEWDDRSGASHPDAIGVFGMLPPLQGVDQAVAKATMLDITKTWKYSEWGWDFPWIAMAAARHGEPELAIDALLHKGNRYDERGMSRGWYLPGNGGMLYAVAMMAAGWDGAPARHAPGFPTEGWVVKWEGLKTAP
jgi:hypothetical protein